MNKLMRKLPTIGAALFLLVQITGLSEYMARILGMKDIRADIYAVTLEVMIFGAFYWTRQSVTTADRDDAKKGLTAQEKKDRSARLVAFGVGIIFMIASGVLNTLKTMTDFGGQRQSLDWYGALIAGISPTLFAALLGVMQGFVDRLPYVQNKSATDTLPMRVYAIAMKGLALINARLSAAPAQDAPSDAKKCARCGQMVQNGKKPGVMGAHGKHDCPKRKMTQ